MAGIKTVSTPRGSQILPRGRSTVFNRCISSNITMVHGEDGKAAVVAKQSTFSVANGPSGVFNIRRVEERCSESSSDGDTSSTTSECSESTPSLSSNDSSVCPGSSIPVFRVKSFYAKTSHDALRLALRQLGWREQAKFDGSYDIYWHGITYEDTSHDNVTDVHAINKLPGLLEISHKVQLSRILKRMQNLYPGEFDFYPSSWVLPEQFHQFIAEVGVSAKNKSGRYTPVENKTRRPSTPAKERTFIVKPDQGRQGDGIYLVTDPRDVHAEIGSKPCIVQEYIDSPLLLDGFKFDLRIYVVIARLDPIEIYLCKEGLARLCTAPYELPNKQNVKNAFMHLTNYSLNKNSEDFVQTDGAGTGSKRTLTSVEEVLSNKGYDVRRMRREIKNLTSKTILAILPDLTIWSHASGIQKTTRCFQILGFDVMLSSDMKAHLLEVNAVPSLRIDAEREIEPGSGVFESIISAVDEQVKVALIKDTLELVVMGEENIDMSASCLKRIYPVGNPSDPPRTFREFQQRIRLCDKTCREHNTHRNSRIPTSLVSQERKDSTLRRKPSPGWFCNRHCPHCHATILRKRPTVPTVITYPEKRENHMSTDWRFFDHHLSGSTLLKYERQPMVNRAKYKLEPTLPEPKVEPQSCDEEETYKQCPICGGYLCDAVGPGVVTQRNLRQSRTEYPELPAHVSSLRAVKSHEDTVNGVLHRDFKLTPAHTGLFLPRYNTRDCESPGQKALPRSPTFSPEDDSRRKRGYDSRATKSPMAFGKKTADERAKEPSFHGYHVMLLRRCAKIFIYFNGIKACLTMGATAFRNMARKCNLCDQGALPSIDILFIDALRQWQNYRAAHGTPYYFQDSERKDLKYKKERLRQAAGLPFQGFVDALIRIASQRYRGETLREKMDVLVVDCERYIAGAKKIEKEDRLRLKARGGTLLSPWERPQPPQGPKARLRNSITQRRSRYTSQ